MFRTNSQNASNFVSETLNSKIGGKNEKYRFKTGATALEVSGRTEMLVPGKNSLLR